MVEHNANQWQAVRGEVESLFASFQTVGVVFQQSGWQIARRTYDHDGRR